MTERRSCPCHPDLDTAIAAHQPLVTQQARALLDPSGAWYDDLVSDGLEALWLALAAYDPARGDLTPFLRFRIRARMIDGLRRRTGRGAAARPAAGRLPDEEESPIRLTFEDETADISILDALLTSAAACDARLPRALQLLAEGWNRTQAACAVGLSRTGLWRLLTDLRASA